MKFKRQVSNYETAAKNKGTWKRNGFIFHLDTLDIIKDFTGEQVKELLFSMCRYQKGEEVNIGDKFVCMAFGFIIQRMERETAKYLETCKKRQNNGAKGGKSKQKQTNVTDNDNDCDCDNDCDNDCDGEGDKEKSAGGFIPPTIKEIQAYINKKGFQNVDAERFYYYYESIGWINGKSHITKWQPLVNRWETIPDEYIY